MFDPQFFPSSGLGNGAAPVERSPVKVSDIMDPDALEEMASQGYVSRRSHPDDPNLYVLNYTHSCQYDRAWNDVTRQCRGLIVRGEGGDAEIIARPWPKFFNYGEHEVDISPTAPARVQDKYDGSLGILYPAPDGKHAIATRGSFDSEQALHATAIWRERYEGLMIIPQVWTYLFEIVYPANRIVVDYGELDDIVLLDVLSIYTGLPMTKTQHTLWPGPVAHTLEYASLAEALEHEETANSEGFVVSYPDGTKLKIKHEDYVRLHRIVTGLNEKTVWEHLRAGRPLAELLEPLPDEFRVWAEEVATDLWEAHRRTLRQAMEDFRYTKSLVEPTTDPREYRKRFAALAVKTDVPAYLFSLLDGKDISDDIWRSMKPDGSRVPKEIVE